MSLTECFLITSKDIARIYLRRYRSSAKKDTPCPAPMGYHNADGPVLGEFPQPLDPIERVWHSPIGAPDDIDHADPRWPIKCDSCDYRFTDDDEWQLFSTHLYVDPKGQERTLNERTPGMMWFCPWYFDPTDPKDQERFGKSGMLSPHYWRDWAKVRAPVCVICPGGGQWCVDQLSSNGDGWRVTGTPPLLSCTPSIVVPGYHGFLGINGVPPGFFTGPL